MHQVRSVRLATSEHLSRRVRIVSMAPPWLVRSPPFPFLLASPSTVGLVQVCWPGLRAPWRELSSPRRPGWARRGEERPHCSPPPPRPARAAYPQPLLPPGRTDSSNSSFPYTLPFIPRPAELKVWHSRTNCPSPGGPLAAAAARQAGRPDTLLATQATSGRISFAAER